MTSKAERYHACCLANIGVMHFFGSGTEKNGIYGICLITKAATMGLAHAALLLGDLFASGKYGLPKDLSQSVIWYNCATKCTIQSDGCDFQRLAARRLEILNECSGFDYPVFDRLCE